MISYKFLLNRLVFLSFLITIGCVQKGIKNDSPSEGAKNQKVVETTFSERNSSWVVEFSEDFSKMEIGSEPESLFILDGAYTVQVGQNEEKILTLPGSPMGDFGLLFGPRIREKGLELRFSFFSRKKRTKDAFNCSRNWRRPWITFAFESSSKEPCPIF